MHCVYTRKPCYDSLQAAHESEALAVVMRYKSHPAILLWGFGNEKNFQAPQLFLAQGMRPSF